MPENKAVFNRPARLAGGLNDQLGIYFAYRSNMAAIKEAIPYPLDVASPIVTGYIIDIRKPGFAKPFHEAMLQVTASYKGKIGTLPIALALSGPGAEMATYGGRELSNLPKKICEREDCVKVVKEGNVVRGTVERHGTVLLDVSMELGDYNNPMAAGIWHFPESGKSVEQNSFSVQTPLELDEETGLLMNKHAYYHYMELMYHHYMWQPGKVTVRVQSSEDDPWGELPVFENIGGGYSNNDMFGNPNGGPPVLMAVEDAKIALPKLMTTRYDAIVLE